MGGILRADAVTILELIAALETGGAAADVQMAAAPVFDSILSRYRLPRGVPLRARGEKRAELSVPAMPEIAGDWLDRYEILRLLQSGAAPRGAQCRAAWLMLAQIVELRLDEKTKRDAPGRPKRLLKPAGWQLVSTVDMYAGAHFARGSKRPFEDALEEIAAFEATCVSTIRRAYRTEKSIDRRHYLAFAAHVDRLLAEKSATRSDDTILEWALREAARNTRFEAYLPSISTSLSTSMFMLRRVLSLSCPQFPD